MFNKHLFLVAAWAMAAFVSGCGGDEGPNLDRPDVGGAADARPDDVGAGDADASVPGDADAGGPDADASEPCAPNEVPCADACCEQGERCFEGACCSPDCDGRNCGSDGCGGVCGTCDADEECVSGICHCVHEELQRFCERSGFECGLVSGEDNCGAQRIGVDCGECVGGDFCVDNRCYSEEMHPSNETCEGALPIQFGDHGEASVELFTRFSRTLRTTPCSGTESRTVVYSLQALGESNRLTVRAPLDASDVAPSLWLTSSCGALPAACAASAQSQPSEGELVLSIDALPQGTWYLWAKGFAQQAERGKGLRVALVEEERLTPEALCEQAVAPTLDKGTLRLTGETAPATSAWSNNCVSLPGGSAAFQLTLLAPSSLSARAVPAAGSTLRPRLLLATGCVGGDEQLFCGERSLFEQNTALLSINSLQPETYYLIVVGDDYSSGSFELELSLQNPIIDGDCEAGANELVFDESGVAFARADTTSASNDLSEGCSGLPGIGRDLLFTFELTEEAPQSVILSVTPEPGSLYIPMLSLRRTCEGEELRCAVITKAGEGASLRATYLSQGHYYLWVDAYTTAAFGAFTVKVEKEGPSIPPPGDDCARPLSFQVDAPPARHELPGTTMDAHPASGLICKNHAIGQSELIDGPVVFHALTFSEPAYVQVSVEGWPEGARFAPALSVTKSCGLLSAPIACDYRRASAGYALFKAEPTTYVVAVGGEGWEQGDYRLKIETHPLLSHSTCATALPLDFGPSGTTELVWGDNAGETNALKSSCATGSHGGDQLYSFVVPGAQGTERYRVEFEISPAYDSEFIPLASIRRACENAEEEFACAGASAKNETLFLSAHHLRPGPYVLLIESAQARYSGLFTFKGSLRLEEPPPPNDSCAYPLPLSFDEAMFASATGDTGLATNDGNIRCKASTGGDLVYTFRLSATMRVRFELAPTEGSGLWPALSLRGGNCEEGELLCRTTSSQGARIVADFTAEGNQDYFVWVDASASGRDGPFLLTATASELGAAENDRCATAEPLLFEPGTGVAWVLGASTASALDDYDGRCVPGANGGPDLVYSLEVLPSEAPIHLTARLTAHAGSTALQPALSIRRDCSTRIAAMGDEADCAVGANGLALATAAALPAGIWYVVVDGIEQSAGAFDLRVERTSAPPLPDSCFAPESIDLEGDLDGIYTLRASTAQATHSYSTPGSGPDLVYTFTTQNSASLTGSLLFAESSGRAYLSLRTKCDSAAPQDQVVAIDGAAGGPTGFYLKTLPPNTYWLWIDGASTLHGDFELALQLGAPPPPPPVNATCQTAEPLQFDEAMRARASGDTGGATNAFSGSCATMDGGEAYYSFSVPAGKTYAMTAILERAALSDNFAHALVLRKGCGAGSYEGFCSANPSGRLVTMVLTGLDGGSWYLVVDGKGKTGGRFALDVSLSEVPHLPETCDAAERLTLDGDGHGVVHGDTSGARSDSVTDGGLSKCSPNAGPDLVYLLDTHTLGTRDLKATLSFNTALTTGAPALSLRSACDDTPSADEELACVKPSNSVPATLSFDALPGGEYWLWVDSTLLTAKGPFTLVVDLTVPIPTPVTSCSSPKELTFDNWGQSTLSWSTTGGASNLALTCTPSNITASGPEAVFKLVLDHPASEPISLAVDVVRGNGSASYRPVLFLMKDSCSASTTPVGCSADSGSGLQYGYTSRIFTNVAPGTYYLVVDSAQGTRGQFELKVAKVPNQIPNDCGSALPLPLVDSRAVVYSSTSGAGSAAGSCASAGSELVYTFTIPQGGDMEFGAVLRSAVFDSSAINQLLYPSLHLHSSCALSSSELFCEPQVTTGFPGVVEKRMRLAPGTYYLYVDGARSSTRGAFKLEVQLDAPPATTEFCASATAMPAFDLQGRSVLRDQHFNAEPNLSTGTCEAMEGGERYFRFTIPDGGVRAWVTSKLPGTLLSAYLLDGCGEGRREMGCAKGASSGNSALTRTLLSVGPLSGGTYYLAVDGKSRPSYAQFDLELESFSLPPAPASNSCNGAIDLGSFDTLGRISRYDDEILPSARNTTSGRCGTMGGGEVYYRFYLDRPAMVTAQVTALLSPRSSFKPGVYIRSDCASSSPGAELACGLLGAASFDTTISAVAHHLEGGRDYFVIVDSGDNPGTFALNVTRAAPSALASNDTCENPEPLRFEQERAFVEGTLDNATHNSTGLCGSSQEGHKGPDLVYSFTLTEPQRFSATLFGSFAPALYLRSGSCASTELAAQVACDSVVLDARPASISVNSLPRGEYFLWVDTAAPVQYATFSLLVLLGTPLP